MSNYSGGLRGRNAAIAERVQERRRREDACTRLAAEVPDLVSLDIVVTEHISTTSSSASYVRRVVIAAAPALFEIQCGDPTCENGGHDLTIEIMRALRTKQTSFNGEHACRGSVRNSDCARRIQYVGTPTYRA
jgi:hypothetical protein